MRSRHRYRVRYINLPKLRLAAGVLAMITSTTIFGQGISSRLAQDVDGMWLKALFCRSVPVAYTHIRPEIGLKTSTSELLFGFDIKKPLTLITNQIAVVHAAERLAEDEAVTIETAPVSASPSPTLPPNAKPISEVTINPQSANGYASADGILVKNNTDYTIDVQKLLNESLTFKTEKGKPQVLIVHTHTSEAFTPTDKNYYEPTDPDRTEDPNFSIVRVGREMAEVLNKAGIETLHDTTLHDYPSYNGSYKNCLATVQRYLKEYPSIKVVLDIHRDAMTTSDGSKLKVCTTIDGVKAAQVMILSGTDANGLDHPNWRENFKLALRIQSRMNALYPTLARPLTLVRERYNMNTTNGSLLIEVGSNGNTLEEAVNGGRLCADAIAKTLNDLK